MGGIREARVAYRGVIIQSNNADRALLSDLRRNRMRASSETSLKKAIGREYDINLH